MKLCTKPKFKSTCTLINDARASVNTVHKSAKLNQDWDRMCPLSLVADVPTRFDSTFLTSHLASEEVAAVLQDFVIQHSDKVTTNLRPGSFHWNVLKDFNRLMERMWSSTQILSSDHFSVSHLFPLMTMLLPRYLEREMTIHSSFPILAKMMLDDLTKRFSWLCNDTYFQLLKCLDPGYYVIFSKPPLSARNKQMKELLATEYATWVVESSHNISEEAVSVPYPSTEIVTGNSEIEEWSSVFSDEWDNMENTEEQPIRSSNAGSQSLHPILKQFD